MRLFETNMSKPFRGRLFTLVVLSTLNGFMLQVLTICDNELMYVVLLILMASLGTTIGIYLAVRKGDDYDKE